MLRKIDTYIIRQFFPPYITAFLIVEFVLILQFLWKYIDDIMGKGTGLLQISELIFYLSFTLFPTALPWAILMASVMVLGNLAERYELSSMKSAGISLMRVMRPLLMVAVATTLFSLVCSEWLIPYYNLKFQARFYDIRRQKPTMSLEPGVFNDDFTGYTIRVAKKHSDGKTIEDVLIYDNFNSGGGRFNMIAAKKGEMYTTADKRFMIMELYDGYQAQEVSDPKNPRRIPFLRTSFSHWTKLFDMSQFSSVETDDNIFKDNLRVLGISRLWRTADSTQIRINERYAGIFDQVAKYLNPSSEGRNRAKAAAAVRDSMYQAGKESVQKPMSREDSIRIRRIRERERQDSAKIEKPRIIDPARIPSYMTGGRPNMGTGVPSYNVAARSDTTASARHWADIQKLPRMTRIGLAKDAETQVNTIKANIESVRRGIKNIEDSRGQALFELHTKLSLAAVCLLFLFIGAPMGAIIQKGGFGYPLLMAILFFAMYLVLSIWFKNMAKTGSMEATLAAWLPFLLYIPICAVLTYRALNDYKIANFDANVKRLIGWFARFIPKKAVKA